ncbi:MAG: NrsF family protein [Myxococcales bacterium]
MSKPLSASELRERTLARVAASPAPTRKNWLLAQALWLSLASGLFVALALSHGLTPMLERPRAYVWTVGLSFAAVGVLAGQAFAAFLATPLGAPRRMVTFLKWATLPSLVLGSLAANGLAPETLTWPAADPVIHCWCPLALLFSGGIVGALALRTMRGADPVTPRATALALGTLVGVLAALAVSLHCEFADPIHVLTTHVLPVGLLMAGMARWGARTLKGPP